MIKENFRRTLYKRMNANKKVMVWTIWVEGDDTIVTRWGTPTGKKQITRERITSGKNLGRANATTINTQANRMAVSRYEAKLKEGYVKTKQDALLGAVDPIITGGIAPMLAHDFSKHKHHIKYPALVQPKLDGIRCIATKKQNGVLLWSRTRKPITSCPHIIEALEKALKDTKEITLDGELYLHDTDALKDSLVMIPEGEILKRGTENLFEKIASAVMKKGPSKESSLIQYHIYDVADNTYDQSSRISMRDYELGFDPPFNDQNCLKQVETVQCNSEDELKLLHDNYVHMFGYEGAMVRNVDALYENKRSYNLQKVKQFDDHEFEIVGWEEGIGKLAGHIGAFVCLTVEGKAFNVKPKGEQENWNLNKCNPKSFIGKMLTVQYQGLTKYGVPRFPIGLRIRGEE